MYHYLNDVAALQTLDTQGLFKQAARLSDHIDQALYLMSQFFLPPHFPIPKKVLVVGAGHSSTMVMELISTVYSHTVTIPLMTSRGYPLPAWVDRHTLVLMLSVSGHTPEILQAYYEAQERQAKIIVISQGGELGHQADLRQQAFIQIPADAVLPQYAWPFLLIPVLCLLDRLDLIGPCRQDLEHTIPHLEALTAHYQPATPKDSNLAKQLACQLYEQVPVIYSSVNAFRAVAQRWQSQFCENSQILSHCNTVVHLNQYELAAWDGQSKMLSPFQPVLLRDHEAAEHLDAPMMMQAAQDIEARLHRPVIQLMATGKSVWERLFSLISLGNWVSLYLAMLYRVSPAAAGPRQTIHAKQS